MLPHLFVWLEFAFEMFCGADVYCALLRCFWFVVGLFGLGLFVAVGGCWLLICFGFVSAFALSVCYWC